MKKTVTTIAVILVAILVGGVKAEKLEKPVRLNFGVSTWAVGKYPYVFNTITTPAVASRPDMNPLKDIDGVETLLQAEVTDDFAVAAANGPDGFTADNGWSMVNPESRTYLLGVGGPGRLSTGAPVNPTAGVALYGLDVEDAYNIYVLCSMGKKEEKMMA